MTDLDGEGGFYRGPTGQPVAKEVIAGHFPGWEKETTSLIQVRTQNYFIFE